MFVAAAAMMFASCDKDDSETNSPNGNTGSNVDVAGNTWVGYQGNPQTDDSYATYTLSFNDGSNCSMSIAFYAASEGGNYATTNFAGTYTISGNNGTLTMTDNILGEEYNDTFTLNGDVLTLKHASATITMNMEGNTPDPDPSTSEWVDLGLSSGLLWRSYNLGTDVPEGFGGYYAWGETQAKTIYNYDSYAFCNDMGLLTKYCNKSDFGLNGFVDMLTTLLPEDDAATMALGNGMRMPTKQDWEELLGACTSEVEVLNGVKGRRLTGPNGRSIFLPLAGVRDDNGSSVATEPIAVGEVGYYWSSMMDDDWNPATAWVFNVTTDANGLSITAIGRTSGMSVRPVRVSQ